MAFGSSGWFVANMIDVFDATQLAIDLSLTTHKVALYTNTKTPNFSTDTGYNSTAEVSGTNYTAGGTAVSGPSNTESPTGTQMYDLTDTTWSTATISSIRGAEIYADALAGDNLILGITFGADYAVTAGTLTIQYAATGVGTVDWTP